MSNSHFRFFARLALAVLVIFMVSAVNAGQLSCRLHDADETAEALDAFINELEALPNNHEINRQIEQCYEDNKPALKWFDVRKLLDNLRPTDNYLVMANVLDSHTREATMDRISESYLEIRSDQADPAMVADIAAYQRSPYERNRLIKEYAQAKIKNLDLQQLMLLLEGLGNTYRSLNEFSPRVVTDELLEQFFQAHIQSLKPDEVVRIAEAKRFPHDGNRLISQYYQSHKHRLDWKRDVERLLEGLRLSHHADKQYASQYITDGVSASYLELHSADTAAELAIEIAGLQSSPYEYNRLIESFISQHNFLLCWEMNELLMNSLTQTPFDTPMYSLKSTRNRIILSGKKCQ